MWLMSSGSSIASSSALTQTSCGPLQNTVGTSKYDSSVLFCTWIHHFLSQLSIFVKSSSHNLWYFVGLNFFIAMCCSAGGNYSMWLISSESNKASSLALPQTSCGPCKIETSIRDSSSNPNQSHHFVTLNFLTFPCGNLKRSLEQVETIWCGWWALNALVYAF